MIKDDHYNEGFSENSGVKIFYRDYGPKDGDPILMVHGLGAVSYTHLTLPTILLV